MQIQSHLGFFDSKMSKPFPVAPMPIASTPNLIDQLRRAFDLDHLHIVVVVSNEPPEQAVRILFSTWPLAVQAAAVSERWHSGALSTAARRSRRGLLPPGELSQAASGADIANWGVDAAGLGPHWLFPLPSRAGTSGEIWVGRSLPLAPHEEGFWAACALPLMRAISTRFSRLAGKPKRLTPREIECLRWASEGKTTEEVSLLLAIAPTTVETHFKHAATKLAASNRSHAVAEAIRAGIIS